MTWDQNTQLAFFRDSGHILSLDTGQWASGPIKTGPTGLDNESRDADGGEAGADRKPLDEARIGVMRLLPPILKRAGRRANAGAEDRLVIAH